MAASSEQVMGTIGDGKVAGMEISVVLSSLLCVFVVVAIALSWCWRALQAQELRHIKLAERKSINREPGSGSRKEVYSHGWSNGGHRSVRSRLRNDDPFHFADRSPTNLLQKTFSHDAVAELTEYDATIISSRIRVDDVTCKKSFLDSSFEIPAGGKEVEVVNEDRHRFDYIEDNHISITSPYTVTEEVADSSCEREREEKLPGVYPVCSAERSSDSSQAIYSLPDTLTGRDIEMAFEPSRTTPCLQDEPQMEPDLPQPEKLQFEQPPEAVTEVTAEEETQSRSRRVRQRRKIPGAIPWNSLC